MRCLFSILGVVFAALPARAETPVETILANTLTAYVRPSYEALNTATNTLVRAAKTLCETPSADGLKAAQATFKETVGVWSKVEWFRTGAVMNDNRIERMFYFPDRKGLGLKQVQAALAKADESATDAQILGTKSVAMQGLGASEFLLFGAGSESLATKDGAYRCVYFLASAGTMSAIAGDLQMGWDENSEAANFWQKPAANNPFFRTDAEALNLMIGTLVHGLDAIRDMRLNNFIGKTPDADKPKLAAYWRSENTFASIGANLEGLQNLYQASQIQTVLPAGNEGLLRTIKFDFANAIKAAKALDRPVAEILSDADLRKKAAYVQLTVQIMIAHFNTEFALAAGLDTGFSFGDGD
jgi:uncharacterized protein